MPNKIATKTSFQAGKNHTFWKGGTSDYYRREARKITNYPENKIVHHKDGDWRNNKLNNLQILSQSEHLKLHHKNRRYSTKLNSVLRRSIDKVIELRKKGLTYKEISNNLNINLRMVKQCIMEVNKMNRDKTGPRSGSRGPRDGRGKGRGRAGGRGVGRKQGGKQGNC